MKYVMFNKFYPVIHPEHVCHCDVTVKGMEPTSAGHFHTRDGKAITTMGSTSLNMKPAEHDAFILTTLLDGSHQPLTEYMKVRMDLAVGMHDVFRKQIEARAKVGRPTP